MAVMMEVNIDCVGTDKQIFEVFKATLLEIIQKFPGALLSGPSFERLPGREKDMVILKLPVDGKRLNEIKSIIGPTWRRIAFQKGRLPDYAIKKMREKGELPK